MSERTVDDLICGWTRQNGFCVDASLVSEGTESGDGVTRESGQLTLLFVMAG